MASTTKRNEVLHVKVQEKNHKWVKGQAAKLGVSMCEFVDKLLNKGRIDKWQPKNQKKDVYSAKK